MKTSQASELLRPLSADPQASHETGSAPGGVAPTGGTFTIIGCASSSATVAVQSPSEQGNPLVAALLSLPADERAAVIRAATKRYRPRSKLLRPDFRRQIYISVDEAMELTGLARPTIMSNVCRGRIKRGGVGRYYLDQASVIKAFTKKGK